MKLARSLTFGLLAVLLLAAVIGLLDHVRATVAMQHGAALGLAAAGAVVLAANSAALQWMGGYSATLGLTALDIIKLNAADDMTALIEKNKLAAPELGLFPSFDIVGTSFDTCIRTGYPAGAFTPLGGGVTPGGSTFDNVKIQCYNYQNPLQVRDKIAKSHRRGLDYALALSASGAVKGGMELMGRAIYYGARAFGGGDFAFPGLVDLYDVTNKFVDAEGTTAGTGSSVWFVKFGDMEDGMVSMVFGNNRGLTMREWILQQMVVDAATNKVADIHTNELSAAVGVQLADIDAVVRIGKLTEETGKGLTDKLGYRALEKYPVDMVPDLCLMTKRSRRQLQESRSAVGQTAYGAGAVAPIPTDLAGIPIVVTDSILNTESLSL